MQFKTIVCAERKEKWINIKASRDCHLYMMKFVKVLKQANKL